MHKTKIKNLVVVIQGGLGKVLSSTPAIKQLKIENPDKNIVVLSGWPDVFIMNPYVHRSFSFNENKYLYEDYLKEGSIIDANPYHADSYRFEMKHLALGFCDALGVKDSSQVGIDPLIYLPESDDNNAMAELNQLRQNGKKVIIVQYLGGAPKDPKTNIQTPTGRENLQLFSDILNGIPEDANWLIMKALDQPTIPIKSKTIFAKTENVHFRNWMALIKHCDGFLGIDSCGHHMAAAFSKPSVVVWGRTKAKQLGTYKNQIDISGQCPETDFPCNEFLQIPGVSFICKYDYKCIKSINKEIVIEKVKEHLLKLPIGKPVPSVIPLTTAEMAKLKK